MRRICAVTVAARFPVSTTLLRRLAFANILANVLIVVTGGAVRLTASGLGCPTWPRCTDTSYTATPEMGVHGMIEYGNRLLTFAVGIVAIAVVVAVLLHRPRRRGLLPLAVAVLLGIPAQAVIGGITVLTKLNPWVVGLHFLASMVVIALAYALWRRIAEPDGPTVPVVPGPLRTLAVITTVVCVAVLVVGTWVTGSGPHAGDGGAARNGLDPEQLSQVHADGVFLLIGLSVALVFAFRAVGAAGPARAALVLVGVEAGQGVIGYVQYFTNLPALLVGAHMLGSCLVLLATLAVLRSTRERRPATDPTPSATTTAGDTTTEPSVPVPA
ncbi:COX15/CtaA family protein [Salinispora vitiensis]|uniref:COX15/CtaA family protein n=1 Tax=Salinispora vitiensis TaxID=999544 RepID=UPI0004761823|nr:COX15/CtaA family protein [Salinispora vitiensis]